jgi:hypothetical protein
MWSYILQIKGWLDITAHYDISQNSNLIHSGRKDESSPTDCELRSDIRDREGWLSKYQGHNEQIIDNPEKLLILVIFFAAWVNSSWEQTNIWYTSILSKHQGHNAPISTILACFLFSQSLFTFHRSNLGYNNQWI